MTTLREAAQMALDALEKLNKDGWILADFEDEVYASIEALRAALAAPPEELELPKVRLEEFLKLIEGKEDFRGIPLMRTEWPTQGEALAQPKQEPVAWWHDRGDVVDLNVSGHGTPLYFNPPQRDEAPAKAVEWQGLTLEEREELRDKYEGSGSGFISAIEAKLKEKNHG